MLDPCTVNNQPRNTSQDPTLEELKSASFGFERSRVKPAYECISTAVPYLFLLGRPPPHAAVPQLLVQHFIRHHRSRHCSSYRTIVRFQEPTIEELESAGWIVQHHTQPHTLLDGCFYISGKIPRKSRFEDGQPGHMR